MDKGQRIQYLLQTCKCLMEKWDKLSNNEKIKFNKMMLEVSRLSYERTNAVFKEYDNDLAKYEERVAVMDGILASYEAYILEKGLKDDYESFLEEALAEFADKNKPNLTVVN